MKVRSAHRDHVDVIIRRTVFDSRDDDALSGGSRSTGLHIGFPLRRGEIKIVLTHYHGRRAQKLAESAIALKKMWPSDHVE